MRDLFKLLDENEKYYIYGTSNFGQYCCAKISERFGTESVLGFIQTVPDVEMCRGKKVFAVSEANVDSCVIITGFKSIDDMKRNLIEAGFEEKNIIIPEGYKNYFIFDYDIEIKRVCFWPPIEEYNKDLIDKISWFIPDRVKVGVWTENTECIEAFNDNVEICSLDDVENVMDNSEYVCIWDMSKDFENIGERHLVRIVDPNFFYLTELNSYRKIYYNSFSREEREKFKEHSVYVFAEMKKEASKYGRSNVFCTGPSIQEVVGDEYSEDFNIICNSMVKDKELLSELKPKLLTFGDFAFYVSPNDYCKAFYADLLDGYRKYNYYILVHFYEVPLLAKHFPEISESLIGISNYASREVAFIDEQEMKVIRTKNVCTLMMLPIASVIADVIGLAGCTGRNPDETYFWKHNERTQYHDLMHCVFEAYPSFFRDEIYEDYYDEHCECMKKLIDYGESLGKKYTSLTTSFIPSLKERSEEK